MKNLLSVLTAFLALSASAFADLSPARQALDYIETILEENGGVNNGDYGVQKYDVSRLSIGAAVADYKRMDRESECSYRIRVGRGNAIKEMQDSSVFDGLVSKEVTKTLRDMQSRGLLRTIISAVWDGEEGDSEACSNYYFDIYTTDGYLMHILVSHTD
jgi:hypothetical protein